MTTQQEAVAIIQKAIADGKHVFGTKVTLKKLKTKAVKKIFLTTNVAKNDEDDIRYYASLNGTDVEKLTMTNEELSIICKKPFLVGVVAIAQ
ncbi:MAG TPA: ribosomal L7Ae/L30e/S12e/Gadd45 family protein [Acidobacteriota bacterium]|nr:ribosomal L7Ae/L30e/S12e/Gadd45 family protein [Acidobacteriota bacterium]